MNPLYIYIYLSASHVIIFIVVGQRSAINHILRYTSKNRLPDTMREQMLAHMQLKFKTAELRQEEVLQDLPKAIRSSINQHLFRSTIENAYLFKGFPDGLIVQLVIHQTIPFLFVPFKQDINSLFFVVGFANKRRVFSS